MSQFADPAAPSSGLDYKEINGRLLLVQVLSVEDHVPTVHSKPGEKSPAVRANVTVLDGPTPGTEYEDTLIFPKVLQSQLRSRVGQMVLGRLGQGYAKPGQSAPWQLAAATDEDKAVADQYMRRQQQPQISSAEAPF